MIVKLLTEHHLKFLSLKGGCTGSSESTLVKMPHCWKSQAAAQVLSRLLMSSFNNFLTLCMLGNFACFYCLLFFFKLT